MKQPKHHSRDLRFVVDESRSDGYGSCTVRVPVAYDAMMHEMLRCAVVGEEYKTYVKCSLPGGFFRKGEAIGIVDADSEHAHALALGSLNNKKVGWCEFKSSPDRYWIITDVHGSPSDVLYKMETVLGMDPNYIKMARADREFVLRCYLKTYTFRPIATFNVLPSRSPVKEWAAMFEEFWKDDKMTMVIESMRLRLASPGTIDGSQEPYFSAQELAQIAEAAQEVHQASVAAAVVEELMPPEDSQAQ